MDRDCAKPSPRNNSLLFIFFVASLATCHAQEMILNAPATLYAASNGRDPFAEIPAGTRLSVDPAMRSLFLGTNWVAVSVPRHLSVWVNGEFAPGGKIAMNNIHVRAGAGAGFKSLGAVAKGTELEVRGTLGEWLRVAPPDSARVWVDGALLKSLTSSLSAESALSKNEEEKIEIPAALAGVLLSPNVRQGWQETLTGIADWPDLRPWDTPATLTLATSPETKFSLLVEGDVTSCVGARVTVRGTLWQLAGHDTPLMVVEELTAHPFSLKSEEP